MSKCDAVDKSSMGISAAKYQRGIKTVDGESSVAAEVFLYSLLMAASRKTDRILMKAESSFVKDRRRSRCLHRDMLNRGESKRIPDSLNRRRKERKTDRRQRQRHRS
jgi:hypothetical protein